MLSSLSNSQLTRLDRHGSDLNSLVERGYDITVIDTVYKEVIITEEVVVFVDQFGTPFSTMTMTAIDTTYSTVLSTITHTPTTTSKTSAISTTSTSTTSVAIALATSPKDEPTAKAVAPTPQATDNHREYGSTPAPVVNPAPVPYKPKPSSPPRPDPTPSTSAIPPPPSKGPSTNSGGYGFSYSPYMANGACKSAKEVATDFAGIPDIKQYSIVRIYGTDCNQVATILPVAKSYGLKLFAGVFDINQLNSEISAIVAAAKGDWSSFDTISIGNELVNSGAAPASTVVAAIGSARGQLRAAGFTGSVVTVDTLVATRANPALCDASDYCTVNCHPFFDGHTAAADSGEFLSTQISTLRNALSNKNQRILISETGWPWKGRTNGKAVPSPDNQAAALSSIKRTFASHPQDLILFTVFNDLWKADNAYTFDADQFWGYVGYAPSG